MSEEYTTTEPVRETVGLFEDAGRLQDAVRELESTAFPRDAISVLGTRHQIEEKFGQATVDPDLAEDDPAMPRQPPVRPEERNIAAGALVGCAAYVGVVSAAIAMGPASIPATLMAIVLGGGSGAALGAMLLRRLGHKFEHNIEEQIARGGLVLWVRTPDHDRETIAQAIMERNGAKHIRTHEIYS